jgi:alanine dehydrogenase
MIIGIPKESWGDERRVALTPAGVHALQQTGHSVLVQSDAGLGSGFSTEAYREAGAAIAYSAEEIFGRADLLLKVLPPTVRECEWIPERCLLFSAVHLGALNPKVHEILRDRAATAVGLELIEDSRHGLPVVTAMGEIAGMLLPQIAGRFLETTHGGRGILLGGAAGIPAANVVIIGAGTVGTTAARMFLGAGANVTVMDDDINRLRHVEMLLGKMTNTVLATPYTISRSVVTADVVVGAILIRGRRTPHVVSEAAVRKMRHGSLIIDVSIDQGGCVETSRPTRLSEPVFVKHGITHHCVPNIPASVSRAASHALNNVMLSYVTEVADRGAEAFAEDQTLQRGVYMYDGRCTREELAALLGWELHDINSLVRD